MLRDFYDNKRDWVLFKNIHAYVFFNRIKYFCVPATRSGDQNSNSWLVYIATGVNFTVRTKWTNSCIRCEGSRKGAYILPSTHMKAKRILQWNHCILGTPVHITLISNIQGSLLRESPESSIQLVCCARWNNFEFFPWLWYMYTLHLLISKRFQSTNHSELRPVAEFLKFINKNRCREKFEAFIFVRRNVKGLLVEIKTCFK